MNGKILAILAVGVLAGPMAANAVPVQSTTGVYATFRDCVGGATACDTITPTVAGTFGGNPGDLAASASQSDAAYGTVNGNVALSGAAGAPYLSTHADSLGGTAEDPGTRNSTNSGALQRYTYDGAAAATRTFTWNFGYDQDIPDPFGTFPFPQGTSSGVSAYLEVFRIDDAFLDAGTTAQDNWNLIFGNFFYSAGYLELDFDSFSDYNTNPAGAASLSVTTTFNPGDSVWIVAWLQTPSANGSVVNAYTFLDGTGWDNTRYLTPANSVPEPGTLALLGLGLVGLGFSRRRKSA